MKDNHLLKKQIQILKDPKWIILLFAIIILIVILFLFYLNSNQESQSQPRINSTETKTETATETQDADNTETETETAIKYQNYVLGGKEYALEIADDADEHQKGLSGRTQLPAGQGMLFIFPISGNYGIWMKDMNFAIDIIWLDAERRIVGLKENAQPASYPEIFYGEDDNLYVIEINAGEIAETGLQIGDQLFLNDGN